MPSRKLLFIIWMFVACKNKHIANTTIVASDTDIVALPKQKESLKLTTHLSDTEFIKGNFILFLRPDSARFESYAKEGDEIYEADSDFGFGISATMDSLEKLKQYHNIKYAVSDKRYISITNCKSCPTIIDRDSIDYGIMMISPEREMAISTMIHSMNYLTEIDTYFNIKN